MRGCPHIILFTWIFSIKAVRGQLSFAVVSNLNNLLALYKILCISSYYFFFCYIFMNLNTNENDLVMRQGEIVTSLETMTASENLLPHWQKVKNCTILINSINISFENSIKMSQPIKIPDNGIQFSFIPLKFHQFLIIFAYSGAFHFFLVPPAKIRRDHRVSLTVKGQDLVAIEVKYHRSCYREYTRKRNLQNLARNNVKNTRL